MAFGLQYRLRFIDKMLRHYGTINRSLLVDYFGLSVPQVSHDIGVYLELYPGNMVYDTSAKTYRRTEQFKEIW